VQTRQPFPRLSARPTATSEDCRKTRILGIRSKDGRQWERPGLCSVFFQSRERRDWQDRLAVGHALQPRRSPLCQKHGVARCSSPDERRVEVDDSDFQHGREVAPGLGGVLLPGAEPLSYRSVEWPIGAIYSEPLEITGHSRPKDFEILARVGDCERRKEIQGAVSLILASALLTDIGWH
jgi:hypothetical protein